MKWHRIILIIILMIGSGTINSYAGGIGNSNIEASTDGFENSIKGDNYTMTENGTLWNIDWG